MYRLLSLLKAGMPDFEPSNVGNELRRQTGGHIGYVTHSVGTRCPIDRTCRDVELLPHSFVSRISYAFVLSLRSLATPFLVFYSPRALVHPQSLLSIRSRVPYRDQEQDSISPCISSCISGAQAVRLRCTGGIPSMYGKSGGVLSSSRHPLSFGLRPSRSVP
jgi:hypothetical protein